jgi:hypothetical protein
MNGRSPILRLVGVNPAMDRTASIASPSKVDRWWINGRCSADALIPWELDKFWLEFNRQIQWGDRAVEMWSW